MASIQHFGVKLRQSKHGFRLNRANYVVVNAKSSFNRRDQSLIFDTYSEERKQAYLKVYTDMTMLYYTDNYCEEQKKRALENFDLNMKFYKSLDHDEFNKNIESFLKKNKRFKEIYDLNPLKYRSGYYMLILDEYCQVYIGNSNDIRQRIMSHWSKTKEFDRLIFGRVENSMLSIDSFRAFDTTRIFVYLASSIYMSEDKFIKNIKPKFCINRTAGGGHESLLGATMERKTRNFTE